MTLWETVSGLPFSQSGDLSNKIREHGATYSEVEVGKERASIAADLVIGFR